MRVENITNGIRNIKITIKEVVLFFQLALIYIVGAFEIGAEIMLRYMHKIQQAIVQGIEQGCTDVYRVWYAEWEKRKQDAAEKVFHLMNHRHPIPTMLLKKNSTMASNNL